MKVHHDNYISVLHDNFRADKGNVQNSCAPCFFQSMTNTYACNLHNFYNVDNFMQESNTDCADFEVFYLKRMEE